MASKLSIIFGSLFVIFSFIFMSDLLVVQAIQGEVYNVATNCAIMFSKLGATEAYYWSINYIVNTLNKDWQLNVLIDTDEIGHIAMFKINAAYKPLLLSDDYIIISVTKSSLIGIYDK